MAKRTAVWHNRQSMGVLWRSSVPPLISQYLVDNQLELMQAPASQELPAFKACCRRKGLCLRMCNPESWWWARTAAKISATTLVHGQPAPEPRSAQAESPKSKSGSGQRTSHEEKRTPEKIKSKAQPAALTLAMPKPIPCITWVGIRNGGGCSRMGGERDEGDSESSAPHRRPVKASRSE